MDGVTGFGESGPGHLERAPKGGWEKRPTTTSRPAGHLGSAGMATHDVTMNLSHPITVMNVDVEFEVRSDGELMGKVQISRGGIDWMPFKSHPRAATWEQFAAWMEGTA